MSTNSAYSYSESESFTVTHARHIAAKVATDLLRFQRFYGRPPDSKIDEYEAELVALLKHDYLETVTYGFRRNGLWVEALRYRAVSGSGLVADDDPGRLRPGLDVTTASFGSYLTHSGNWFLLSASERERFEQGLPFRRD